MENENVIRGVAQQLGIVVNDNISVARQLLIDTINDLLQHDFNKLIAILYRVDVNENKLQSLLHQHPGHDAADIIADLLIERQLQKMKSRAEFRKEDGVSDEEKW